MRPFFAKIVLVFLACLIGGLNANAQGWERTFGFQNADGLNDVLPTPDGGYIAVGSMQLSVGIDRQVFLVKTDADGNAQWTSVFGDSMKQEFAKSIVPDGNGGYVIGGTTISDGIPFAFLARTDQFGHQTWKVLSPQDSVQGRKVIRLSDGSYALVGTLQLPAPAGAPNSDFYLMKADADGNVLWTKTYGGNGFEDGYSLVETGSGDLILVGFTNSFGMGGYDAYMVKTNAFGDVILTNALGTGSAELSFAISPTTDGNYVLTGQQESQGNSGQDIFLAKITPDCQQIWWHGFPLSGIETARSVVQTPAGQYVLVGDSRAVTNSERQVFLLNASSDGYLQWQKEFGGVLGDGGNAIRAAPNSGYVIAGFTASFGAGSNDGYLIRTDASGLSLSNFIRGNVHSNLNNTCVPDNFGVNVPNYLLEIAGANTYYGTTDGNGDYSVPVPAGSYNVRLLNPSPIWETCQDSVDVTVVGVFDTATVNFSIYSQTACPAMEVDLTTLSLRRCFQNIYTVNYRNLGSQAANPATVEVTFDPWLTVDSTSIPWVSHTGNTYLFDIGTVQPFAEGSFLAYVTLDCDSTVLGQTHCSEAHIYPDAFCFAPDPAWDGASIQLEATCTEDSIFFRIQNLGIADMMEPQGFIVIEDQILQMQGEFQLDKSTDTLVAFAANGATFRMEANQSPGHPGNSQPCVSVEGCGASPFSIGFVVDYPLNDADLFVDTDCRENIGSFDPNDKQGFPVGYGEQHFIRPGTDIEYLIRFQNTGTDTAFTVTVRDTLSKFLDPTSIEPGAASHPYRYELYGGGILKFTFENILLPDSNTNEALSHGFVKFRAKQQAANTVGHTIENRAGIYFDFNEPVVTNTVFHTLAENFIVMEPVSSATPGTAPQPEILVYPNPFNETALFELKNVPANPLIFSLFDANGRLVRRAGFNQNKFQFERDGLPSGMYFFQIQSSGTMAAQGKLVLR
jgi:uncharacterized repeat protein (TIGR01451 family)